MRRNLALALMAAALPFGGALSECTPTPDEDYRVIIVGDSITWDTREEFPVVIDDVLVDGERGRGWDSNLFGMPYPNFRQAIVDHADDVRPGGWLIIQDDAGTEPTTAATVAWVLSVVPDDVNIGWVSPSNNSAPWLVSSQQAIQAEPSVTYIDWHGTVKPHMLPDGLHPNQEGQWHLTHLVWSVTG